MFRSLLYIKAPWSHTLLLLLFSCYLFATPCQASMSFTNSQSLLKHMSLDSVMPSNHLILCHPLLLLPSIFPSFRVFSKSALHIRWTKYRSFSFSASNEYSELVSFRIDWFDLVTVQESPPTPQFKSINSSTPSLLSVPTLTPFYRLIFLSSIQSQHFGKSCPNMLCPSAQAQLGPQCPASWVSSQPLQ